MNDIKLDDFKIGDVYGFMVVNEQNEVGKIEGCVMGYTSTQLGDCHSDMLMVNNIFSEKPDYVALDNIRSYYHLNQDDEEYIDAELYNPDFDELNIERGTTVKDIIAIMINNWDYYDPNTRKNLVCKFSNAVTTDVLVDLITAYAESNNHNVELNEKYLKALDRQAKFIEKYNKFRDQIKSYMPKGYDKILDVLIFDVCEFGR